MGAKPPPMPLAEYERRSSSKPIAVTLLCGFLLAGGSCFGALKTFNYNRGGGAWWFVFMALFVAGGLICVVAFLLLIVRAVQGAIRKG